MVHPSVVLHTLGIKQCSDGSGSSQIKHSTMKARELFGKLQNSGLTQHAKWMSVESIITPAIMYPLVNTLFQDIFGPSSP
jgi:hypothetical protein